MKVVNVVLPVAVALVCCGGEIILEESGDSGSSGGHGGSSTSGGSAGSAGAGGYGGYGGSGGCGGNAGAGGAGCGGGVGGGGGGGSGGSVADADSGLLDLPIVASATGYVPPGNVEGVVGAWYAYGDGWGSNGRPPGVCEDAGHPASACSVITYPLPTVADAGPDATYPGFAPTPAGSQTFCIQGSAAFVANIVGGTSPDYANIYGIAMGINLNTMGSMVAAYNANTATAKPIVGFQFTITGAAAITAEFASIRVAVPMVGQPTSDEYFNNGSTAISTDGTYRFLFFQNPASTIPPLSIGMSPGGYTVPITQTATTFDPTRIEAIQFDIVSSTQIDGQAPTPPGGVCISNLTLLAAE
jgi:hypothetical protein